MKKFEAWYIIDEDENEIVDFIYGTEDDAKKKLEELDEARMPGDANYWNVWRLFKAVAA